MRAISNEELERRFDDGEDITAYMDPESVSRPNLESGPIVVDVPARVMRGLGRHAARAGVDMQSLARLWLVERLDQEDDREAVRRGTVGA